MNHHGKRSEGEMRLVCRVEEKARQQFDSPKDFVRLSQSVLKSTSEYISPTTLKRIWGYLSDSTTPRVSTLDVLARYIGYLDYAHFSEEDKKGERQSDIARDGCISVESLSVADRLVVSWLPDRCIRVVYQGYGRFVITEAQKTQLAVGDSFSCHLFINHEPLFLDRLIHQGRGPYVYLVGKKDGIKVERE